MTKVHTGIYNIDSLRLLDIVIQQVMAIPKYLTLPKVLAHAIEVQYEIPYISKYPMKFKYPCPFEDMGLYSHFTFMPDGEACFEVNAITYRDFQTQDRGWQTSMMGEMIDFWADNYKMAYEKMMVGYVDPEKIEEAKVISKFFKGMASMSDPEVARLTGHPLDPFLQMRLKQLKDMLAPMKYSTSFNGVRVDIEKTLRGEAV